MHNTKGNFITYRSYAQYQYKFTDNLSVFGGVNALANSINSDFAIEPRAGLEWKIDPLQTLTFGYGKHSQMQPASVYYLQYNDSINNRYIQTNNNTGLTKADHLVLGYSYQIFENLRIKCKN